MERAENIDLFITPPPVLKLPTTYSHSAELRAATVRPSTVMTPEMGKGLKLFWKKSVENAAQERNAGK